MSNCASFNPSKLDIGECSEPKNMPDSQYEFKPFKYSSHYWILQALRGEKEPVKILDVGTASGYLGKIWRRSGHYVAGIEYDAATAESGDTLLAEATAGPLPLEAVGAYVIEVTRTEGGTRPIGLREEIRAFGPTA